MEDFHIMQDFQPSTNLNENIPYFSLLESSFLFLVINDFLVQISTVSKFHDNTLIRIVLP